MDKIEDEYKSQIVTLLGGMIQTLMLHNLSEKSLSEAELILTALVTKSFEYGLYSAEKDKSKMS